MSSFDFRKELRSIANQAQDDNVERLLSGEAAGGGALAPLKQPRTPSVGNKRMRVQGKRVSLKSLQRLGVKSGAMLADADRRSNIRLSRTSFKIVPSGEIRARWFGFNVGSPAREARPFSGLSDSLLAEGAASITKSAREQVVKRAKRGR